MLAGIYRGVKRIKSEIEKVKYFILHYYGKLFLCHLELSEMIDVRILAHNDITDKQISLLAT